MSDINAYTAAEIANLTPQSGDLVLNTDDNAVQLWNGSAWKIFNSDVSPFQNQYSVDFDGSNDYVDITGARGVFDSATAFSISLWYYADAYGGAVFGSVASGSDGVWILPYNSGNNFYFNVRNVVSGYIQTTSPALNQWVHVVATYNAGNGALYLTPAGGSTSTTTSTSLPTSTSSTAGTDLSIGRQALQSLYFNGKVDEVAIWDSELSSSDVTTLYNSGVPGDISSLNPVGHWRMGDNDGGTGTTITDQGSGGNDATLTNGPTFSTDVPS